MKGDLWAVRVIEVLDKGTKKIGDFWCKGKLKFEVGEKIRDDFWIEFFCKVDDVEEKFNASQIYFFF